MRAGYLDTTSESLAASDSEPWLCQTGVLRTNCLDCLDRTNVVQFYVAWDWLHKFCLKHEALRGLLAPRPLADDAGSDGALAMALNAGASLLGGLFGGASAPAGNDSAGQ